MQHRLLITTEQQNAKAPYINETTNVYCKNSFLQRLNTHNGKAPSSYMADLSFHK